MSGFSTFPGPNAVHSSTMQIEDIWRGTAIIASQGSSSLQVMDMEGGLFRHQNPCRKPSNTKKMGTVGDFVSNCAVSLDLGWTCPVKMLKEMKKQLSCWERGN